MQAVVEDSSLGSGVWVDLGTGSGALALGLATALPGISQVRLSHFIILKSSEGTALWPESPRPPSLQI